MYFYMMLKIYKLIYHNLQIHQQTYILKYIHFEPFKFDILKLKENINAKLEKNQNVILFDYNTNKVFDKSKTYTVNVGEDNEV